MLREWKGVRQRPDEGPRRWFSDDEFDLIVWYAGENLIAGFQLCYGKTTTERALTWYASGGFSHSRVDDGESTGITGRPVKATPILVSDGLLDTRTLADQFRSASAELEPEIRSLVLERLESYEPG